MRPRLRARAASTRVGSSRNTILLATEESYPSVAGDHADWCDALVHGLPEYDFVLWSLSATPQGASSYRLPPNAVRWIDVPPWGAGGRVATRAGGDGAMEAPRPPADERVLRREFAPALHAFLDATSDPAGPGGRLAELLMDLRALLLRWEPGEMWRSSVTTLALRDHLVARALDRGQPSGAGCPASETAAAEDPTERDAVEAGGWLSWVLAALAMDVPATDLAHVTASGFCALPGILAKVERGTPLLLTEPANPRRDRALGLDPAVTSPHVLRLASDVGAAVARACYRLADRIIVVSPHIQPLEHGAGTPVNVVPAGIDEQVFRPVRVQRPDRPAVVQVSRIDPRSDLVTLLRVADLVRREIPDVLFVHHGEVADGAYWERLRTLHRDMMLGDTVRFEGPAPDLPWALAAADVALVTSVEEAFPFAIVAALLCELPVVAADPGGVRQLIEGAGITAAPGDAAALAEAVAATLRISPEQRAAIGRAGRDRALSRFRLSRFLDDYRAAYRELMERGASRPGTGVPAGVGALEAPSIRVDAQAGPEGIAAQAGPVQPAGAQAAAAGEPGARMTAAEGGEASGTEPDAAEPGGAGAADDRRAGLSDPDPMARVAALTQLDSAGDVDLAAAAMADPYPQVRREAVRAIGRLGGPHAGSWLADAVAHDPSAEVREEAVAALAALLANPPANEQPA